MSEAKQKPVKQYRRGAIGVSIWKREVTNAEGTSVFYNATASRAFTKDDGKTFEYSDSFGIDDMPVVATLLQLAFMWIVTETNKEK